MTNKKDWGWYIGCDEEIYTSGPETYDDAVRIAREEYEGAHICEAYKEPVRLSKFFDAGYFLELCNEHAWDDYIGENGDVLFDVTPEDCEALQLAVRTSIEKWQAERNLVFTPFMFSECRNHQYINAEE